MSVADGPDGVVYVPMLYDDVGDETSLRLGRSTSWSDGSSVRGCGQRVFVVGERGVAIGQMTSVEFA